MSKVKGLLATLVIMAATTVLCLTAISLYGAMRSHDVTVAYTDAQCDSVYHEMWLAEGTPTYDVLVHEAVIHACPLED